MHDRRAYSDVGGLTMKFWGIRVDQEKYGVVLSNRNTILCLSFPQAVDLCRYLNEQGLKVRQVNCLVEIAS